MPVNYERPSFERRGSGVLKINVLLAFNNNINVVSVTLYRPLTSDRCKLYFISVLVLHKSTNNIESIIGQDFLVGVLICITDMGGAWGGCEGGYSRLSAVDQATCAGDWLAH